MARLNAQDANDDTGNDELRRPNLVPIQNICHNLQRSHKPHFDELRRVVQEQKTFTKLKFTILSFQGKYDCDGYCDWENKVNFMFEYYKCPEEDQVPMLSLEFTYYTTM
ncbi:hypothetical protein GQ457_17G010920 [Hibiscus cannabinus]